MSRRLQVALHFCAGIFGLIVANGLLDDAAAVYSWTDAQHHLYTKICIGFQTLLQTAIGAVAQSYNTDGTHQKEPGPAPVPIRSEPFDGE